MPRIRKLRVGVIVIALAASLAGPVVQATQAAAEPAPVATVHLDSIVHDGDASFTDSQGQPHYSDDQAQDTYPGDADVGITFPSLRTATVGWPREGYQRWELVSLGDGIVGHFRIRNLATQQWIGIDGSTNPDSAATWILAPSKYFDGNVIRHAARYPDGGVMLYDECLTSEPGDGTTYRKLASAACDDNRREQVWHLPRVDGSSDPLPVITDQASTLIHDRGNGTDADIAPVHANKITVCNHGAFVSRAKVQYMVRDAAGNSGGLVTKEFGLFYAGECEVVDAPAGYITGSVALYVEDGANCGQYGVKFTGWDYDDCNLEGGVYTFAGPHAELSYELQGTSCYPWSWSGHNSRDLVKETRVMASRAGCPSYLNYFFGGDDALTIFKTIWTAACTVAAWFFPPIKAACSTGKP